VTTGTVWLVLTDPLSTRIFFDCGIVDRLRDRLGDRLHVVFLLSEADVEGWRSRLDGAPVTFHDELFPARVSSWPRVWRRADRWLDRQIGFFPLALRVNLRHGFHSQRMRPGHRNTFLDPTKAGPLPRWSWLERPMLAWHYGRLRYRSRALSERLRRERPTLVLSNIQMPIVVPLIVESRRRRLPMIGYVASWDHTVGKGVIWPGMTRYLVQNDVMRDDLARYHGIEPERVVVTGWPQTDVFHRRRVRADYDALIASYGLDPSLPLVLVMGNTPTNAPFEQRFVERLIAWWADGPSERFQLLFRPHPRDSEWHARFAAADGRKGVHVQAPSYTDIDDLALLLQHGDCVVANAGTILLDSLVNDRPAVCVLYDEGAPVGESWAVKNVSGEHYKKLVESDAFYRAHDFDETVAGIERALAHSGELEEERRRVALEVMGVVDGRAAERVVAAIVADTSEN
jgi:hypothetical protein